MRKNKTSKVLPKIGAICEQFIRCGKPNCRCSRGKLHGPYFYMFYREGSRLRKVYVRREDVEKFREARESKRKNRNLVNQGNKLLRDLRSALKDVEGWLN
jgi:hypothetical protein